MNFGNHGTQADDLSGKIYDAHLFKQLIQYLKPYRWLVFLSFVILMCITATELSLPMLTKTAVDKYIVSDNALLQFSNQQEYQDFVAKYPTLHLPYYQYGKKHYLVINTKQRNFLKKEDVKRLTKLKQLSKDKYVILPYDKQKEALLMRSPYIRLSNTDLAIRSVDLQTKYTIKEKVTISARAIHMLKLLGLLYLIIIFARFLLTFSQIYVTNYFSQHAMNDLRRKLFDHLSLMPVSFFDHNPIGRLVTRVTNDIRSLDEMLSSGLITIIQDSIMVVSIMVLMLIMNWQLALVSFIVLPFVFWVMAIYKKKTRLVYREVRKKVAALNSMLAEHISGAKIIQLFNQYAHKQKDFSNINEEYFQSSISQMRLFAFFRPIISVSQQVAVALILWYGGGQILSDLITIGAFMAFTSYLSKLYEPINDFSEKFDILQAAMAGSERIFELMNQPVDDYREDKYANIKLNGSIDFKNLWLSYNDNEKEWVLKDVSFSIKAGEKVAIVGHTGSGKTSIVNLILGMYPYQKGDILLDGISLKDYAVRDIRQNIGIVQQDVFLFSGNIRENIALNNDNMTDEQITQVAQYINVQDFIQSLKGGLYEEVMERGSTFSVGQRQLISFARVLAYNPSIFILDEATSNIDTETEILIQDALKKLMQNRTSIIIAHRLSTIQHCDRIIVLNKGKIVEEGSHQELLQKEGLYFNLYRLQYT